MLRTIAARHALKEQQVVEAVSDLDVLGLVVHPTSVDDLTVITRLQICSGG